MKAGGTARREVPQSELKCAHPQDLEVWKQKDMQTIGKGLSVDDQKGPPNDETEYIQTSK